MCTPEVAIGTLVVMQQNETIQESASPTVIHLDPIAVISDIAVAQMRARLELLWGFLEYCHGKEFAANYTADQNVLTTICVAPKDPYTMHLIAVFG